MAVKALTVPQILTMLAATPSRIAALTAGLTPAQLRTPPNQGEWSLNDILSHLRSCADVWGDCITTILAQDKPTIRAINPQTWVSRTDYPELEFQPSLQAFTQQRTELLAILQPLPRESWEREATITGAGKPLIRTVRSYADWLAIHERSHFRVIARLANTLRP